MGRMAVGRFATRAEALDFLAAKYTGHYTVIEARGVSSVVLKFVKDFRGGKKGEVAHIGHGADLSEAIRDLFSQLEEEVGDVQ